MQLLKLVLLWHGQELNQMSNCRVCGEAIDEHSDIEITRCYQTRKIREVE